MSNKDKQPRSKADRLTGKRFERMLEDATLISERFAREPVYGPTGKGYYKSAGVEGLREDIKILRSRKESDDAD